MIVIVIVAVVDRVVVVRLIHEISVTLGLGLDQVVSDPNPQMAPNPHCNPNPNPEPKDTRKKQGCPKSINSIQPHQPKKKKHQHSCAISPSPNGQPRTRHSRMHASSTMYYVLCSRR